MRCPGCGASNPDDALFCGECGNPLAPEAPCPKCSRSNPRDLKFCRGCGARLDAASTIAAVRTPSLPSDFGGGRYRIERFLGEGGRKRVYLARDTRLERDVALALIKTEGLDEAGLTRVRREAQAMARLGDHANIVTVFDIGEEDGTTYLVCQYMSGGSVDELIMRSDGKGVGIEESIRIATQVAHALEHAHERGIVHRDVKPGNVWLGEDGTAQLGDFGLAVALDRSRLTAEGMMLGTVAYMAPEQALGRPPDARSDLYALGGMLYELLTGRPPFLGDEAVAIISQHIGTQPVAPSWHNPEVSPPLERLTLSLLAKDPEKRPATAREVHETLSRIASVSTSGVVMADREDANPLDRLAGGVFVGREREMDELRGGLDDALSGRGRLLMLVGEPGIGKTRMSDELATYARLRGAQVLVGRCYEGEGAPAYWPWVQIIRSYVHDRAAEELVSVMGPGAADIAQVCTDVRERIPGLAEPPALEPEQARFRLFDSLATFLRNASRAQPLVVVVDDMHWADKPSLLLLQFLVRELGAWRLLILGTYRDVELRRQHPLAQTLAQLAREPVSSRVVLRGLTEDDVARYIEMTAGVTPRPELVRAVHRETEGNPFFVSEIVRLLASEGTFEAPVEGSWSISIPQSVREVVGRRLDQLSESSNALLRIASVVGREFALGVVQEVSDLDPSAITEAIEEAREARVIAETPRTVDRYIFSHALIRETLYEEIPTTRRVMLHRRIGEVIEMLTKDSPDSSLAELAYHFLESAPGGDVEKAVSYAERAAARASSQLAYEEATRHLRRGLDAMELVSFDPARRCALLLALGEAERRAGDVGAARDAFFAAAEIARTSGDARALADAAIGLQAGAQFGAVDDRRVVILEQALDLVGERDLALRSRLLGHLARALYFSPDFEYVRSLAEQTVSVAESASDRLALAEALSTRAYVLWAVEPPAQRVEAGDRIVEIARRVNDTELLLDGLMWRLIGLTERGDVYGLTAAVDAYTKAAEESRITRYQLYAISRQAMLAGLTGRFDESKRLSEAAYEIGVRAQEPDAIQVYTGQVMMRSITVGDRDAISWGLESLEAYTRGYTLRMLWIHLFRAFGYFGLGDIEAVKREYRPDDVRALIESPPQGVAYAMSMAIAAEVASRLGDVETAEILFDHLKPYADRVMVGGGAVFCIGLGARYLGALATLLGRLDEADAYLVTALEKAKTMGARPFLAQSLYDHAALRLTRRAPGDGGAAVEELDRCLALAHELGMTPLAERAVALKLEAQGMTLPADTRTSIDRVASVVSSEQPDLRRHAAPDGTVTLLFSDIEGSTALNERVGDRKWIELLRAHNALVREQVAAHGGFEVKSQGDGFMLAFSSARRGVMCAIDIQRALAAHAEANPDEAVRVRIGLHTGEAIIEAGDFYGRHVNFAARVGAAAHGGEILVSSLLRELTSPGGEFDFAEGREVELKGLAGSHLVYPVRWQ